ncbi:import component protein [Chryseobacterium indologenes]|uniref:Import component protein n=1 Tax=Chryseobacterium indologenes TaxID=253 RepID=A0A0N0IV99_CHRID|nr:import component protein [Chryseobacterium indologenes]KPE50284.1 import component protein [Chryseobacterium indologenes]
MNSKTLSVVSYITLIGWFVAFIMGKEKADGALRYHLKQALGLAVFSFVLGIILRILMAVTHIGLLGILGFIPLILAVIGIINAANEAQKPLPFIGKMSEDKFSFIG